MKITSKLKSKHNLKIYLRLSLAALAVVLVIGQIVFDVYTYRTPSLGDESVITNLIIGSVEAIGRPAVVEPTSGKAYIPDAKLVFPAYTDTVRDLRYSYLPSAGPNTPTELQITTANNVHAAESKLWAVQAARGSAWSRPSADAVFDNVPNLQACARGLHIFFGADAGQNDGFINEGSVKLADGRRIYIYREKVNCQYMDYGDFINYLKQAKSY